MLPTRPLPDAKSVEVGGWGGARAVKRVGVVRPGPNRITKFAADADAYATQVPAHTAIPQDAKVAVIQAAAYAHMKSLDPKCGIRSAVSAINAALEVLVRAQP